MTVGGTAGARQSMSETSPPTLREERDQLISALAAIDAASAAGMPSPRAHLAVFYRNQIAELDALIRQEEEGGGSAR